MALDMFGRSVPNLWELGPREGVTPEWVNGEVLPVNRLGHGQVYAPAIPYAMQRAVDEREHVEYAACVNPSRYLNRHGHLYPAKVTT